MIIEGIGFPIKNASDESEHIYGNKKNKASLGRQVKN